MLVVGERINTSRPGVEPAVRERNKKFIIDEVVRQASAGAGMIDVNAGTLQDDEAEALNWLVQVAQGAMDLPLCIDSPDPDALMKALRVHNGKALINSITGEDARFGEIFPLIVEYRAAVVALAMDDSGIPADSAGRLRVAGRLVERLTAGGMSPGDIYVDTLVQPVSTDTNHGAAVLETIAGIKKNYTGVKTICGLSNVSYGLPSRRLLNRTFLAMCVAAGLDAVICDPLDRELMQTVYAADAIAGRDEFCIAYITAFREARL